MPAKYIIYLLLIVLSVYSCNKEGEIEEDIPESCPSMSGEFQIDALGNNHILQLDENTNFTILYGWYEENENATVIIGDDQNGKNIYIEASIPGVLSEGTHYYNASNGDLPIFYIDLDTTYMSVSEITFDIVESKLIQNEGMYRPIRGSFSGTGATSSNPSISFTGTFCLNGGVFG